MPDGKFYKADFHIHTPASHCFICSSENNEEEYLSLLKSARHENLDIIAITDHNTIEGYSEIIKIKEKYRQHYETITRFNLTGEQVKEINDINILFSELLILPGIELETRPGIHLLIIFSPNIAINEVEEFLKNGGITAEMQGGEENGLARWDVLDTLEKVSSLDAIVIAAHVDRDKGLYEKTNGEYRRQILIHENLLGLEFKNIAKREAVKSMLRNPCYQRKRELALIQNSDFHNKGTDKLGEPCTYICLEDVSFPHIKEAFENPLGKITSPETPQIEFILQNLEKGNRTYFLENYDEEQVLIKVVIALANAGSGNILIGETTERKRIGLNNEEIENAKTFITSCIKNSLDPMPVIEFYDLGIDKKTILNVEINSRGYSVYSNKKTGEIFIWSDNKPKLIEKTYLAELIKENIKRETDKFLSVKIKRIENLSNQMRKLRDDLEGMHITYKFDKSVLMLRELFEFAIFNEDNVSDKWNRIKKNKKEIEEIDQTFFNGDPRGNIIYLKGSFPARYEQTILRFSVPVYKMNENLLDIIPETPFRDEKLLLIKGGGVFFSPVENKILKPEMVYGKLDYDIVFLKLKPEFSKVFSIRYLLAYLKSLPLLWLSYCMHDSTDIYKPNIFFNLPAPPESNDVNEVDKAVDEILELERKYLEKEAQIRFLMKKAPQERDSSLRSMEKKMKEHNDSINDKSLFLDRHFLKEFDINDDEKMLMSTMLRNRKIFVNPNI